MATYSRHVSQAAAVLLAFSLIIGCTSRYRLDLYQTADEVQRKVKLEKTQYIPEAVLTAPTSDERLTKGNGTVVILTTGTRGTRTPSGMYTVLTYDEYLRCNLYMQLPRTLALGSVPLRNNSFLWLLGRYDQPAEARLFTPESGEFVIDSLTRTHFYGTIHGVYKNGKGAPLGFDGQFKVKTHK